jgi:hypothetical protein
LLKAFCLKDMYNKNQKKEKICEKSKSEKARQHIIHSNSMIFQETFTFQSHFIHRDKSNYDSAHLQQRCCKMDAWQIIKIDCNKGAKFVGFHNYKLNVCAGL